MCTNPKNRLLVVRFFFSMPSRPPIFSTVLLLRTKCTDRYAELFIASSAAAFHRNAHNCSLFPCNKVCSMKMLIFSPVSLFFVNSVFWINCELVSCVREALLQRLKHFTIDVHGLTLSMRCFDL
jgi:hypothetical protein